MGERTTLTSNVRGAARPAGPRRGEEADRPVSPFSTPRPASMARNVNAARPRALYLGFDISFLMIVAALVVVGLLAVYSSSWNYTLHMKNPSPTYILERQALWAFLGLIAAAIFSYVDYRFLQRFALPVMVVTIVMLLAVLVFVSSDTPKRALFGGSVQPSEVAKFAIVFYLAAWLNSKRDLLKKIMFGLIPLGAIIGVTASLIIFQPDFSAALTVAALGILMFILAKGDYRQIVVVFTVAILVGASILIITGRNVDRIDDYLSGLANPTDASDHMRRAMEAIVRGGLFGVGLGKGTTKFMVPVPWTDSVFAVITEETGIIGATVVIGLFVLFLWRGISIANRAPDFYGKLLASGLTLWITLEAMINIGVMANVVPFAGNALPFISYGGSNIGMTLVAIGIIINISRHGMAGREDEEGNVFRAVVDLRRRHGRRSVPRDRRAHRSRE